MARARLLRVYAELLRLLGRLPPCSCDDKHILEPVLIQGRAGNTDCFLALVVGEMLGFAVAALDEDARDTALYKYVKMLHSRKH